MKLLVVDDSPEMVTILSYAMKLYGHKVDGAQDGIRAVERLQKDSYDVVITDAEMPGMGGAEVCKFLKSHFPGVYVIGMSGCSQALEDLREAGADICFAKPFDIGEMEKAVEHRFHPSMFRPDREAPHRKRYMQ